MPSPAPYPPPSSHVAAPQTRPLPHRQLQGPAAARRRPEGRGCGGAGDRVGRSECLHRCGRAADCAVDKRRLWSVGLVLEARQQAARGLSAAAKTISCNSGIMRCMQHVAVFPTPARCKARRQAGKALGHSGRAPPAQPSSLQQSPVTCVQCRQLLRPPQPCAATSRFGSALASKLCLASRQSAGPVLVWNARSILAVSLAHCMCACAALGALLPPEVSRQQAAGPEASRGQPGSAARSSKCSQALAAVAARPPAASLKRPAQCAASSLPVCVLAGAARQPTAANS